MTLTAEQLELRKQGVGASDIPAIAGLLPESYNTSVLTLWLEKTGQEPLNEETYVQEKAWGHPMEVAMREWYDHYLGSECGCVCREGDTLVSPHNSAYLATPDILVMPDLDGLGNGPLAWIAQIKNVGYRVAHKWVNGPPSYVVAQCQWELMVVRDVYGEHITRNDVIASIAGAPPKVWSLEWDPEMVEELKKAADQFLWCVAMGSEPTINSHDSWVQYFERKFPAGNSKPDMLKMPEGMAELAVEYDRARAAERAAVSHRKKLRNRLLGELGDAAGYIGNGWRIKRKWTHGTPWVDVKEIATNE